MAGRSTSSRCSLLPRCVFFLGRAAWRGRWRPMPQRGALAWGRVLLANHPLRRRFMCAGGYGMG